MICSARLIRQQKKQRDIEAALLPEIPLRYCGTCGFVQSALAQLDPFERASGDRVLLHSMAAMVEESQTKTIQEPAPIWMDLS